MTNANKIFSFICLSILISTSSISAEENQIDFDSLLNELSVWIEKNHTFNRKNIAPPGIKRVDRKTLCDMGYKEAYKIKENVSCKNILGLYNFYEKTIYINKEVNLRKKSGKAIVLHELVHHYQFECGLAEDITCLADLEALSYSLERKYLNMED